jgi:hypothetical protein
MSPHRQLSQQSHREPTAVQDIFLGFASSLKPAKDGHTGPRTLEYACVLHDGMGVVESETYTFDFTVYDDEKEAAKEIRRFGEDALALMRKIQTNKGMNVSCEYGRTGV